MQKTTGANALLKITSKSASFTESAPSILTASISRIIEIKGLFRHGNTLDLWETPTEWLPPSSRLPHRIASDLRKRIRSYLGEFKHFDNSSFFDEVVLLANRYLLMLRIGPSGLGARSLNRSLDVTTISHIAYKPLPELLALGCISAIRRSDLCGSNVLRHVDLASVQSIGGDSAAKILIEIQRMEMLKDKDMWLDVPRQTKSLLIPLLTSATPEANKAKSADPHLPLPDWYVAQMASRSLWLSANLSENLIRVSEDISKVWNEFIVRRGRAPSTTVEGRIVRRVLSMFGWVNAEGTPIENLPFQFKPVGANYLQLKKLLKANDPQPRNWPPKNIRELKHVIASVQMAHYFIVALSIGARASEALSLERTSVRYSPEGRPLLSGLTYKLIEKFAGEERDWAIPNTAVIAVERQSRLMGAAERLLVAVETGRLTTSVELSNNLWGRVGAHSRNSTTPLVTINKHLQNFAETLGMDIQPSGQNIRSHRFRKTLARLVALALTQAPKILMEIFGHKSIEMTLHYILSDPSLRAEIEIVVKELRIMTAKKAVEEMVAEERNLHGKGFGGYGGLASITISSAIDKHKVALHRRGSSWGMNSAYELAELLTTKGEAWDYVRRGVICTKLPGETGVCNHKKGRPEPSQCQPTCEHRLEEEFLRADVDGVIQDCVNNLELAKSSGESLVSSFWASEIRKNVSRFPDLQTKWLKNSTVAEALSLLK